MKPALFLDRDGTINVDCPYCRNADQIRIYSDVFEPLAKLSKDFYIIILTNQSGLARGYFTEKDLEGMHLKIRKEVEERGGRIDAFYFCPDLPNTESKCRKPNTGMLEQALKDFEIDKDHSFVIGNSDLDIELGDRTGIRTIRVREKGGTGRNGFYAKDFYEVLNIIIKEEEVK